MNNCNCEPGVVPAANIYNKAPMPTGEGCNGLKTVIIPKNRGTDYEGQPYAPILGGYRNTIVVYEATGSVYLFDNQGIFTNLTGNQLLPVIEELQKSLDSTDTNVSLLTTRLQSEIAERQGADVDMQNLIQTLQTALNTEVTNRTTATDTLTNDFNALEAKVNAGVGDVSAEATAREEADNNLQEQITANQTAISTEADARTNADTQFATQLTDMQTSVSNLAQQVQESEGKVVNLPNELLQSVELNPGSDSITALSSTLDLTTGTSSSTTNEINFKRVNGESIIGEGEITISGGGAEYQLPEFVLGSSAIGATVVRYDEDATSATELGLVYTKQNIETGASSNTNFYIPTATSSLAGAMSAADKSKLDELGKALTYNTTLTDDQITQLNSGAAVALATFTLPVGLYQATASLAGFSPSEVSTRSVGLNLEGAWGLAESANPRLSIIKGPGVDSVTNDYRTTFIRVKTTSSLSLELQVYGAGTSAVTGLATPHVSLVLVPMTQTEL